MERKFVDILEARIPILQTASPRARAWADALIDYPRNPEEMAYLVQTLITDERNRVLLAVEQALIQEMK